MIAITALCCVAASATAQITVSENVHASTAATEINNGEPVVCADPDDPGRLLVAAMLDEGWRGDEHFHQGIAYLSEDGGRRWHGTLDLRHRVERVADPACAFSAEGTAVVSFMTQAEVDGPAMHLSIFTSSDGGRTWAASSTAPHSSGIDRPYVAIDAGPGPFGGRIYVGAHLTSERTESGDRAPRAIALYRSLDGGVTIEEPATFAMADLRSHTTPGEIVVLSDGTVVGLYAEYRGCVNETGRVVRCSDSRPTLIRAYASRDGGATVSKGSTVGQARFETMPILLAVDRGPGPFHDRLYAAWVDSIPGYRATQLMLAYSSDGGETWLPAHRVSDNVPLGPPLAGPDVSRPALSVNAAGVVGLSWYDERESAGREHLSDEMGYHFRFAASRDGGETFLPSKRVSTFPSRDQSVEALDATVFPPLSALESDNVWVSLRPFWVGHTSGLAADGNGAFHPVWVDARTGTAQLWTARVDVDGSAFPNGAQALAELADLSEDVSVELTGIRYDRSTGLIKGALRVRNHSDHAVVPHYVRVISLAAGIGAPMVVGADNGVPGPGALWNLRGLVPNQLLGPGEASEPKEVSFSIARSHQAVDARVGTGFKGDLLHFDARVLGTRR